MEHSLKGKNKHRLITVLLIVVLLFSSFANIWQTKVSAAAPLDKIKIEVTKNWYDTMPSGANLIDNKGELASPGGTPEEGAAFRLYRLGNKDDIGELNHFTDEMYSDLVGLIESNRFDTITASENKTITASDYPNIAGLLKTAFEGDPTKTINNSGTAAASEEFNALIYKLLQNFNTNGLATRVGTDGADIANTNTTTTTNSAGKINYTNISNNSRYVLLEIATAKNDRTKRHVATPMLLDLPIMVDSTGEPFNTVGKDTLHVYPKNEYPVGGSQFYKYDGSSLKNTEKTPIAGAKFLLYKMPAEGTWTNLPNTQLDVVTTANEAPTFVNGEQYKLNGITGVAPTLIKATTSNSEETSSTSTNGEFNSKADGKVSVKNLPKGRYFWVEAKTSEGEYSLNRYPICFEINNTNANGSTTHAATPIYGKGFETYTVPDSSPEATHVFTNYKKPGFNKTLTVLNSAGATLGTTKNSKLEMDNKGIAKFQYSLEATLPNPNLVFGDNYLSFYDIFSTKELGTWDLSENEDDLLNVNTANVFKKSDFPIDGIHKSKLYYDAGQEMLPLTRIISTTLNPQLVIKNKANVVLGYYKENATDEEKADGKYLGGFLDGYSGDTLPVNGIAHLGWFDIRKDRNADLEPADSAWEGVGANRPFEQGTAAGTQLLCTVNVPRLKQDLTTKNQGSAQTLEDVYSISFNFTATPEEGVFEKGVEIDNVGQFEWAGGASEETIIEREVNFKTGGQNFIKLDGSTRSAESTSGKPVTTEHPYNELAGAEFQLRRHTWDDSGEGSWKIEYLQAANANGEAYNGSGTEGRNVTSSSSQVKTWISDVKDDNTENYKNKKIASSGDVHPTVFKSDSNGLISVRGLTPAAINPDSTSNKEMYYDLVEIKTPNAGNTAAKQYRLKSDPIKFAVVAEDLYPANATSALRLGNTNAITNTYAITDGKVKGTDNNLVDILNLRATPFPITGGIGSLFLILLGLLGVAYWYMRKRRMALAEQEAE